MKLLLIGAHVQSDDIQCQDSAFVYLVLVWHFLLYRHNVSKGIRIQRLDIETVKPLMSTSCLQLQIPDIFCLLFEKGQKPAPTILKVS